MLENINWFDVGLGVILLGFAVFGFLTGFTDKFFSLLSWVGAGLLTFHLYPYLKPWVASFITHDLLQSLVTAGSIFLVLLIVFKLGTSRLSQGIKSSPLSGLDRSLGGLFGVLTGFLFIIFMYIGTEHFIVTKSYPKGLQESKIWGFVEISSVYISKILPFKVSRATPPPLFSETEKQELVKKFSRPRLTSVRKGYESQDRKKMTNLFASK